MLAYLASFDDPPAPPLPRCSPPASPRPPGPKWAAIPTGDRRLYVYLLRLPPGRPGRRKTASVPASEQHLRSRPPPRWTDFAIPTTCNAPRAHGVDLGITTISMPISRTRRSWSRAHRMSFDGFEDQQDRDDVIAYLRRYSADPSNIPRSRAHRPCAGSRRRPRGAGDRRRSGLWRIPGQRMHLVPPGQRHDSGIPLDHQLAGGYLVIAMNAYKKRPPHPSGDEHDGRPYCSDEEIAALAAYFANHRIGKRRRHHSVPILTSAGPRPEEGRAKPHQDGEKGSRSPRPPRPDPAHQPGEETSCPLNQTRLHRHRRRRGCRACRADGPRPGTPPGSSSSVAARRRYRRALPGPGQRGGGGGDPGRTQPVLLHLFFSNLYIGGFREIDSLAHSYGTLASDYGIKT